MAKNLIVQDSNETFESWINKEFIPSDIKPILSQASILFVPTIEFRGENELTFPVLTESIFNYFKENLPKGINAEICIADSQYHELALHSDYKRIGNFVVTKIAIPIFVGILLNYINDTYTKPEQAQPQITITNIDNSSHTTIINQTSKQIPKYLEPTKVQFSITVVDSNKTSKEFKYEGPAKDVKTVVDEIKKLQKK